LLPKPAQRPMASAVEVTGSTARPMASAVEVTGSTARVTFDALDSLRGIGAVAVTLWHLRQFRPHDFPSGEFGGLDCAPGFSLYLSVDFFLVLSGFVLTHSSDFSCQDAQELESRRVRFIGQRVARLMPLYVFAKAAARISGIVLSWSGRNGPDWTVLWDLVMSIVLALGVTPSTPSWSLLLCSALCQLYLFSTYGCLDVYASTIGAGSRCASSFLLGICAHRLFIWSRGTTSPADQALGAVAATILETFLLGGVVFAVLAPFKHLDFLTPWWFVLVVVCFAHQRGWLSQVLYRMRFLGTISYSIYLNQQVVLVTLVKTGHLNGNSLLEVLAVYWGILCLYSCLTYYVLEEPCRRRLRSWLDAVLPARTHHESCALPQEDPSEGPQTTPLVDNFAAKKRIPRTHPLPLAFLDFLFKCSGTGSRQMSAHSQPMTPTTIVPDDVV